MSLHCYLCGAFASVQAQFSCSNQLACRNPLFRSWIVHDERQVDFLFETAFDLDEGSLELIAAVSYMYWTRMYQYTTRYECPGKPVLNALMVKKCISTRHSLVPSKMYNNRISDEAAKESRERCREVRHNMHIKFTGLQQLATHTPNAYS
eukprot:80088-Amphidinium_carterae.1